MTEAQQVFYHLGVALAIGLLIGIERGWKDRDAEEGTRVAGVRTYGLIGLLGGSLALLTQQFGPLVLGLGSRFVAGETGRFRSRPFSPSIRSQRPGDECPVAATGQNCRQRLTPWVEPLVGLARRFWDCPGKVVELETQ